MDSHGGWLASAIDLVRFATAFDMPARHTILQPASLAAMFARPAGSVSLEADGQPKPTHYGFGWNVRPIGKDGRANVWHTGSLDGTSTILVRRHDGLSWAVLFNSRNGANGKVLSATIDPLVHQAADRVKTWPTNDLFDSYLD